MANLEVLLLPEACHSADEATSIRHRAACVNDRAMRRASVHRLLR
jgi:hypothetical protein